MVTELIPAYHYPDEIRALFSEYIAMLLENDPDFAEYLKLQNYDAELAHLNDKYGLPDGRLYLLKVDHQTAGCIGLRRLDTCNCEMKRLYIRPQYRGLHLADLMVKRILDDAREIGYKHMLLDTFPYLKSAIQLYKKFGFYEIESYNNSPLANTIYLKLDL